MIPRPHLGTWPEVKAWLRAGGWTEYPPGTWNNCYRAGQQVSLCIQDAIKRQRLREGKIASNNQSAKP